MNINLKIVFRRRFLLHSLPPPQVTRPEEDEAPQQKKGTPQQVPGMDQQVQRLQEEHQQLEHQLQDQVGN